MPIMVKNLNDELDPADKGEVFYSFSEVFIATCLGI